MIAMVLYEKAPAKINLSLDVLRKRNDGFHDVEMIMTTIDLSDRIEIKPLEQDKIIVNLESKFVPNDERNLAYQAAEVLKKTYNITKGVHIKIDKNIPVSAGLGGGSSDAAAVLRGLNRLWSLNIPSEELALLGLQIGSDVPFCVMNSTAFVRGRGELIKKLPSPPSCWVVLAKPNIGISTKTIFQRIIIEDLSPPNTYQLIQSLNEQNFTKISENLGNVLEEITMSIYPEVRRVKEKMIASGASHVVMSGSGPTVYSLVKHENKAKKICNGLRGFCKEVYKVRILG